MHYESIDYYSLDMHYAPLYVFPIHTIIPSCVVLQNCYRLIAPRFYVYFFDDFESEIISLSSLVYCVRSPKCFLNAHADFKRLIRQFAVYKLFPLE